MLIFEHEVLNFMQESESESELPWKQSGDFDFHANIWFQPIYELCSGQQKKIVVPFFSKIEKEDECLHESESWVDSSLFSVFVDIIFGTW